MVTFAAPEIDLFAQELPSMDQIAQLANYVNSSELVRREFADRLQENINKTGAAAVLANGIALYTLGRDADALQMLTKAADRNEKFFYLGLVCRRLGKFDEALENFQKSLDNNADALKVNLQRAETYRCAGRFEDAGLQLANCANFENVSADYHYQLARYQEAIGEYERAIENLQKALELVPDHQEALFQLAYQSDLRGDEEAAMDYYKQLACSQPVHANALLNLAVLYEDNGEFGKALRCVNKVLQFHPNNKRAILFKKDAQSSMTMYYDEEKEKRRTKRHQILETPISDFELSVRSRNCLKKMNIHTVGDLLNITEAELLSYKNFGETSLREIKVILDSKNLRLGMALEQPTLEAEPEITSEQDDGILNKTIDDLQLSVRARKALDKLAIRTLGDLTHRTEAELLGCKNFGVTSLNEIKKAIAAYDLSLRTLE